MEEYKFGYPEKSELVEVFIDDGTRDTACFEKDTRKWIAPESNKEIPIGRVMGWREISNKEV